MNGFFTHAVPSLEPRVSHLEQRVEHLQISHDKFWKWYVNTWRQTCVLSARDRLALAGRRERMPIDFRSQMGEDLFLWNLFEGKLDGFYIEAGAFDGYNLSVSYAFDAVGWDGLLVEPVPPVFEQCRERRPHAHCVNAALSRPGAGSTTTFLHVHDDYGGVLSHIEPLGGGSNGITNRGHYREVKHQVPLRTLDDVLESMGDRLAGRRIDFASFDVEGHEAELLAGFELERWKPRVVLLEDNSKGDDVMMQRTMERRGYRPVFVLSFDTFYIHESETALLRRAADVF